MHRSGHNQHRRPFSAFQDLEARSFHEQHIGQQRRELVDRRRHEMSDGYCADLWRGFDGCNRARNMVVMEHEA
ncbi:hypothetical protein A2U01_0074343, partial [Trifolium medium]|nr:hypothetical protein [Trifolium medium]